jgi:hypothetical protein
MYSIQKKIRKSLSKNMAEISAIKNKLYPEFVYESNPEILKDEVPVFTFHAVNADKFEEQLLFLYNNSYRTLKADELYEFLIGSKPIPEKSVMLTFDDGWKNLYTIAYPLLKKYKMSAVCFLIPGLISLDNKNVSESRVGQRGVDSDILCSWNSIKEMHSSGIIDFQSHSMYHTQIFVSSAIDDFFYPTFDNYPYNFNIPLLRIDGTENISRETWLGTPIYKHASKFAGKKRYFDDQNLREYCIEYVRMNGSKDFFKNPNWRKKLFARVQVFNNNHKNTGYFETEKEYNENIFNDFSESKEAIEKQLPGKLVNHFCYPWWEGSMPAVEASKKAGYLSNFWGVFEDKSTNRTGDDPFKISRILLDDYIFRLPGKGRKSIINIYKERFFGNLNKLKKNIINF